MTEFAAITIYIVGGFVVPIIVLIGSIAWHTIRPKSYEDRFGKPDGDDFMALLLIGAFWPFSLICGSTYVLFLGTAKLTKLVCSRLLWIGDVKRPSVKRAVGRVVRTIYNALEEA